MAADGDLPKGFDTEGTTPAERERLAEARASIEAANAKLVEEGMDPADLPVVTLGYMDAAAEVDAIDAADAMVFVGGRNFGFAKVGPGMPLLPCIEVGGLDWLAKAIKDGLVTCGAYGIGNQIEGVDVPPYAILRLTVYPNRFAYNLGAFGKETPLNISLDGATEAWIGQAMRRFAVVLADAPDRPWMATGPMSHFREGVIIPPKLGRNDPCPCGSGKKFKRCHGS